MSADYTDRGPVRPNIFAALSEAHWQLQEMRRLIEQSETPAHERLILLAGKTTDVFQNVCSALHDVSLAPPFVEPIA